MAQTITDKPASLPRPHSPITLDDYLELIDEEAYEVIDGVLIAMSPQHIKSSYTAHVIYNSLHPHVLKGKLGLVMMETVYALEVEPGTRWLKGSLVPDVAFISKERLRAHRDEYPDEQAYRVAPDLVVEVISPSDPFSAVMRKVKRYLRYGVRLVIVVDPVNRVVHVFTPENPSGLILDENETLTGAPVLPEWSISIKDMLDAKPNLD